MALRMESLAPLINVDSWLCGHSLASMQCMATMSQLVQLQEKYKNAGLQAIGAAAHEHARTADDVRTKLNAWFTKTLAKLNYRTALDYMGEINKLWLDPSYSCDSPTGFVVDRDGCIAFMGHAIKLDNVLPKFAGGIRRER
ncbi:hypothetical protein [Bradyrhizobium iriomotense]|nr:hypothetical protein [Bradyrhizobium iriomotense]